MTRSFVVLNPHAAGGKASRLLPQVKQWLRIHAPGTEIAALPSVDLARVHIVKLPRASRVVVIGGDGTLNQLLPVLLEGGHVVGLVPMGSGNDSARALGLHGLPWEQALAHALHQPARSIDVGQAAFERLNAQGASIPCIHWFLSSLTSGFDSSVGLRALTGPRWLRGLPRDLLATIRELVHLRTWHLSVQTDGQPVHDGEALFASTLNTPSFGSGMPAVPHARVDDGRLDLLLAGQFRLLSTLLMLPRLLAGWHLGHPRVHTRPFTVMQIKSRTPVPLAADGEYLGETLQVSVQVHSAVLPVVMGPAAAATSVSGT